ncbi:MAG: hypothetical protein KIT16_11170 [Rhodospirillaceae bacterium]|nr:hypothetical protein [Rhodospirillaceae bacterium]
MRTGMTKISRRIITPLIAASAIGGGLPLAAPAAHAEYQPQMQRARHNLLQARNNLRHASRDKGGHRVRAMRLIEQALREVQRGIRYDSRHFNYREYRH